ncbi:MAG: tetratricopeptide repeat protein, partial [Planctomycetes bacterium]|nr:tetratricopeptide repeat protein [Planctomycetota bacterium]
MSTSGSQSLHPPERRPSWRLGLVLALAAAALAAAFLFGRRGGAEGQFRSATEAFKRGEYALAEDLAASAFSRSTDPAAALLAARAAAKQRRFEQALAHYELIGDDGSAEALAARTEAGDILLLELKRLSPAEEQYRRALEIDREAFAANDHLAYALGLASRAWEQIPHRLAVIRSGQFQYQHLILLALGEQALENPETVPEYYRTDPTDPAALTGMARLAVEKHDDAEARRLLEQAIALRPSFVEAHVDLGTVLLEHAAEADFLDWHARLPAEADEHPGLWTLRGSWSNSHAQPRAAARCYWEALRRDPNRPEANNQLGRLLTSAGRTDAALRFLQRAERLHGYLNAVKAAAGEAPPAMRSAAELAEELGLLGEAAGWCRLAISEDAKLAWPTEMLSRLDAKLPSMPATERTAAEFNPVAAIDLSEYPLPRWPTKSTSESQQPALADQSRPAAPRPAVGSRSDPSTSFRHAANSAGINFQYFNGGDPSRGMRQMYEFTGGGAAVLDYDGDGWPDLYLTQGSEWGRVESPESSVESQKESSQPLASDPQPSTL